METLTRAGRAVAEPPDCLVRFNGKLLDILGGRGVALDGDERLWLKAFNAVASRFGGSFLTRDDSYALSFVALCRCSERGRERHSGYVRRACRREHLDYLREFGRPEKEALPLLRAEGLRGRETTDLATIPCPKRPDAIDLRLDVQEALSGLAVIRPRQADVLRLEMQGYTHAEIAEKLGYSERHVERLHVKAEHSMASRLGAYDGGRGPEFLDG